MLAKLQGFLQLHWTYENSQEISLQKPTDSPIIIPPQSQLITVFEALEIGDFDLIKQEAKRIQEITPQYLSFAKKLLEFAQEFQEEKIIQLIESKPAKL